MKITVIGSGYVGLVSGSCLSDLGMTTMFRFRPEKDSSITIWKGANRLILIRASILLIIIFYKKIGEVLFFRK